MTREVVISKLAQRKLEDLFEYLTNRWSERVKQDFIRKLTHFISIIQSYPESVPESEKQKGLHRCVVSKQTTLFYRFDSKRIQVVTLFDTRQQPKKLKSEIRKGS